MKSTKIKILLSIAVTTFFMALLMFFMQACQKEFDIKESEHASEKGAISAFLEETAEGYLIGFHATPDPELIRGAGGSIIRSYNNFPILHANIPEHALAGLSRAPGISFVEPNQVRSILGAFSQDCPMDNLVCAEGQIKTFHKSRIGVQAAWRSGATGKGVRIAILDTGIDGAHKDLKDNLASDGFSVITTGPPRNRHWLVDPNGHGTHVAGTAGASGRLNGSTKALLGVAPDVTLVSVRVLRENAYGSVADIAAGIDWCIDNNIDIINMSLGGSQSHAEYVVVETAWAAGLLIVASAGNNGDADGEGENIHYPAAYDEVIAVAATSQQVDDRWERSSVGNYIELIAPGAQVFSTHINEQGYHYMSGTSMAAPHVSGVAALILSANNSLTNQDVRDLLRDNAESLYIPFNHQGHGLVRADKALNIETGRVKGLVYAADQPVYAANLAFSNGSNTYLTTSSGQAGYTIILPPGTYTATATFNYGYDPVSSEVVVNAHEEKAINFFLSNEDPEPDPDPDPEPDPDPDPEPDPKYSITGIVTDEENAALSGALVAIVGTDHSATTGSDGSFEIVDLYTGDYVITASLSGYINQTKSISVTANKIVNFVLEKEADPVDPGDPEDPAPPSIDRFDLTNTSNPQFARVLVNWEVSGENLSQVVLSIAGPNSDSETIWVNGNNASGQHEFSFRRGHGNYTVTLTVTDAIGQKSQTKDVVL